MLIINELQIGASVIFFLILCSLKTKSSILLRALIFLWASTNVAYFYYAAGQLGGSDPEFRITTLNFPWYGALFFCAATLLLFTKTGRLRAVRCLLGYVVAASITFIRTEEYLNHLINQTGSEVGRLAFAFAAIAPFLVALFSPMTLFISGSQTAFQRLFYVSGKTITMHRRQLLIGLGLFVLSYFVTNIFLEGNIANFWITTSPANFVRDVFIMGFFWVLVDHFVFFGLAKYVLDSLFKDQETTMWEIVIYAGLLAGFHFYYPIAAVVREFLFGLVFGYLYLRTGSLTYGIILRTLLLIFT